MQSPERSPRSSSPSPDSSPALTVSERAWKNLLTQLEETAKVLTGPRGAVDALERAEGFRYLLRVLSGALDMHLERADPERPALTRMLTPTRKFLGDNPDTDYDYFPVRSDFTYRIRGQRGNVTYLGFCLYDVRQEGGIEVGGNLADEQLKYAADGCFEIVLSARRPPNCDNWLELSPRSYCMLVRQYYLDRRKEARSEITVENVETALPPGPLDEAELAERFAAVGRYVRETVDLSASLSIYASLQVVQGEAKRSQGEVIDGIVRESPLARAQALAETIDPKVILGHMPTPDIMYTGAWWELADDEAVLVEGPAPAARYWSVQIFNRWLESPDYRHLHVAINSKEAKLEKDGSFRVVLAHRDPGVPNWIETAGHRQGQICLRALLCREPLSISFRRVKLSEVTRD
ncbi:MAG TPA: DUF1214 domain-containing protein [Polyangiaceae bacterium]|nr:DUF1214 domain-containing protein [Polyangiaceae bacterium]